MINCHKYSSPARLQESMTPCTVAHTATLPSKHYGSRQQASGLASTAPIASARQRRRGPSFSQCVLWFLVMMLCVLRFSFFWGLAFFGGAALQFPWQESVLFNGSCQIVLSILVRGCLSLLWSAGSPYIEHVGGWVSIIALVCCRPPAKVAQFPAPAAWFESKAETPEQTAL